MSDAAHHEMTAAHSVGASAESQLFSPAEVEQFEADDVQAGGAIGKMLSALFFYTVIAMGLSGWWTWSAINARSTQTGTDAVHSETDESHPH
jgi:hypothetical protein